MTAGSHWGIVGGGMLGMTLAMRLRQAGHRVTLLEGADQLGGLASTWQLGDVVWDKHYHVTLLSDSSLRTVLDELGLADELRWVETRTGCYTDGRLYSVSNTAEFLRFPPLGIVDKLRLGWTIFHASRIDDWERLEQIPVEDWLVEALRPAHLRQVLEAAAALQAGRELPDRIGRVHLGDHPAPVRRPPYRTQEGDVRLRRGRLRPGPVPFRRAARGDGRRDPARGQGRA